MIYLPGRALFVHIPRTGGNSITNAIASSCAGKDIDIIIGASSFRLAHWGKFQRHGRACILKKFIEEWDDIFKFAIYRPQEDRLISAKGLVDRDISNEIYNDPTCPDGWKKFLLLNKEDRDAHWGNFQTRDWDYFTKESNEKEIGVCKYNFSELNEKWPEICDRCKIPRSDLPHLNRS
jgi:hypothetical protein